MIDVTIPYPHGEAVHMHIREAEPSDGKALSYLLQRLQHETQNILWAPLDQAQQSRLLQDYQNALNSLYLIAEVDGQFVGLASLAGGVLVEQQHRAELSIALMRDYWHLGVGNLLIDTLLDFARHSGIERITLEVLTSNTRAVALYERNGFKIIGTLGQYIRLDEDHDEDAYIMEWVI